MGAQVTNAVLASVAVTALVLLAGGYLALLRGVRRDLGRLDARMSDVSERVDRLGGDVRGLREQVRRLDVRVAWLTQRLEHVERHLTLPSLPEPTMTTEEG